MDEEIRNKVLSHKNKLGIGNMQRNVRLGNSGEMHRYIASDSSKYLVKPAYKKTIDFIAFFIGISFFAY